MRGRGEWKEWKLKSQRRTTAELFNYLVCHCRDAVEEPSVVKRLRESERLFHGEDSGFYTFRTQALSWAIRY